MSKLEGTFKNSWVSILILWMGKLKSRVGTLRGELQSCEVRHRDMDPHSGQLAETSQGLSWSVLAAITKIP